MSENAQQDLKEGLQLYNTDNNIGLRNAWNIIQSEVCVKVCGWVGQWVGVRVWGRFCECGCVLVCVYESVRACRCVFVCEWVGLCVHECAVLHTSNSSNVRINSNFICHLHNHTHYNMQ